MKLVKKWLFPILTCLIVAGAAVLPPYISQVRDSEQFGRIHAEELDADTLSVYEPPTFLDRLTLYARWCTFETIPSYQFPMWDEETAQGADAAQNALERLADAGVLPAHLFWDDSLNAHDMQYLLLWNLKDGMARQEPVALWMVMGELGERSLWMDLDVESGLPLRLSIYDPDMAQWLPYKDPDALPTLAERYFELLGLEAYLVETDLPSDSAPWERLFSIAGTDMCYQFSFNATMLSIGLDRTISYSGSTAYDG